MSNCSNCGNPIAEGVKFCASCGTPVTVEAGPTVCPKCGETVAEGVKFCASCGTPVAAVVHAGPTVCPKCGETVAEGVKFCASCGTAVAGGAAVMRGSSGVTAQRASPADVEENKTMAIIAYFLFFVPLLTGDYKKSPFLKFHTNQATVLFIVSAVTMTVSSFLVIIIIGAILMPLFGIFVFVLFIIGLMNAAKGQMKPLPLIGKFEIIK